MTSRFYLLLMSLSATLSCAGCKKSDPSPATSEVATAVPLSTPPLSSAGLGAGPSVVAESLPRCRVEGPRLAIPGEDLVAGDAAVSPDGLLVGVVRREGSRRIGSVVRVSLDLATVRVLDVGAALGDDPPPSPRLHGKTAFVASFARPKVSTTDAGVAAGSGARMRALEIARVEQNGLIAEGSVLQQADESLAYDVAWPLETDPGPPLVAWDEDAPPLGARPADRGVVKVQLLRQGEGQGQGGATAHVASPPTSDAEAPRLLARRGGYWLAWLARRPEADRPGEAIDSSAEGPGERRAYRWVELVALDPKGQVTSPVRRVSPEKGRVASFDLAAAGVSGAQLVVVVQDEAATAEGAGERIARYAVDGEQGEKIEMAEILDGGVGHALAELLPQAGDAAAPRWLAFTDPHEHAHLVPLGPGLRLAGLPTLEPSLDGTRIVASSSGDTVYAIGSPGGLDGGAGRLELRRLVCR